jgi:hypothetical protein
VAAVIAVVAAEAATITVVEAEAAAIAVVNAEDCDEASQNKESRRIEEARLSARGSSTGVSGLASAARTFVMHLRNT